MSTKDSKYKGVSDNYLSRHINRGVSHGRPSLKVIGDWRREYNDLESYVGIGGFQEFKKMKEREWRQANRKKRNKKKMGKK